MLTLDLARIAAERGIREPSVLLRRLGFGSKYITAIMRQSPSVRLSNGQVEKLCLALNCTPNDLFSWHPEEGQSVAAGHSMQALARAKKPGIAELLQSIPVDRIEEVRTLMMQLSSGA